MYTYGNVYGLKPLMRPFQIIPAGGRGLTIPNQSVNIVDAVLRYSAPTVEERLKGYYEEEGLELPNFDRLDKIERLQLLSDAKFNMIESKKAAERAAEMQEENEKKLQGESRDKSISSQKLIKEDGQDVDKPSA